MFVNDYCKKFLSFQRSINCRPEALSVPWSSINVYSSRRRYNSLLFLLYIFFYKSLAHSQAKIVIKRADRTNRSPDQKVRDKEGRQTTEINRKVIVTVLIDHDGMVVPRE